MAPSQIFAASFNDAATGNWNLGTTWGGACAAACSEGTDYPGSGDTVTIDSHTVTLVGASNANDVTIGASGTLVAGSQTLNVYGSWANSGTFTYGTGTVSFRATSAGKTITTGSGSGTTAKLYNVTFNGSGGTWTLQDNLVQDPAGTTVFTTGTLVLNTKTYRATKAQTVTFGSGFTLTAGSSIVTMYSSSLVVGTGATITASTANFDLDALTVSGTGTFTNTGASIIKVARNLVITSSNWSAGQSTVTQYYTGNSTTNVTQPLYKYEIGLAGTSYTMSTTLLADLTVTNNFTINAGTGGTKTFNASTFALNVGGNWNVSAGVFNANSGTVTFNGTTGTKTITPGANGVFNHVVFDDGGGNAVFQLQGAASTTGNLTITGGNLDTKSGTNASLSVAGNWTNNDTFTANAGTVTLSGTNQTVAGATTFYNLTKTDSTNDSTDRTLTFSAGATTTVSGLLTLTGTDADDRVNLVSSSPGTYWGLTANGTLSINWVETTDSDASLGSLITFTNTVNGGHNLNWNFNSAPTVSTLGPTELVDGSWTKDNTPTLTFTTADVDGNNVAYQLVVDNDSDFLTPTYDATSPFAAAGAVSTTTAALSDASYYWQVRVGDGAATSSWSAANAGVAFRVDTTAPAVSLTAPLAGNASSTVTLTASASDGGTLLGVQFKLDGNNLIGTEDSAAPYTVNWDSTAVADGSHDLLAVARDGAGNYASSTVTVTTDNTVPVLGELSSPSTPGRDSTPAYSFSATEAGSISYAGGCSSPTALATVGVNDIVFSSLLDGIYNLCTITVVDSFGNPSSPLAVTSFVIDTVAPTAGTVTLTALSATGFSATTTGATDADTGLAASPFRYYESTTDAYSAALAGADWELTGLTPNQTYTIAVETSDRAGNTATSTTVATTTLANPPSALAVSAVSSSELNVSWNANSNPAGTEYLVQNLTLGTDSGWVTGTTLAVTGLTPLTAYSFQVSARNSAGITTTAVTASATTDEASIIESVVGRSGGSVRRLITKAKDWLSPPTLAPTFVAPPPSLWERTTETISALAPSFLRPETERGTVAIESPTVPLTAPLALGGEWTLLPLAAAGRFTAAPLPRDLALLRQSLPAVESTFSQLGINRLSDLDKLQTAKINLPGLSTVLEQNLAGGIPSNVIFAQAGRGALDLGAILTVNDQGVSEQRVRTLPSQKLQLTIKPEDKAKAVSGYLAFKGHPVAAANAAWWSRGLLGAVATAFVPPSAPAEERLVVEHFSYADPDGDGLYTAEIETPAVAGEYEVVTVIDYADPARGQHEVRLVTLIDPEGYVFELLGGREARIADATVSIFWENPATGAYELWPAKNYLQTNPQVTDKSGTYSFLVPAGAYYLVVQATGYEDYRSGIFQVVAGTGGVHTNIELVSIRSWLASVSWPTILLLVIIGLLLLNFFRGKINRLKR